ncbi:N-acetyltransferase [Desulfovibrio subterraneus]|jgi:amino-acid N-acetyltransferase|uniref:Acetyltransferase n=1 Tax=Desulfovibrio subterraneus TaxID=2718620 RepID=A0A7J0BKB7_9BACT|nr:N-acetyltransferase [Desulfovibrio subterraneus]WBF68201.1 N-acetyltransferase [Desulfovibrio subterraneus]GFM34146.1 acetyltransferase [Desulfovibrio subterraneus]
MAGPYIRKARMQDVKAIHKLLMECSGQGLLLPRPLNQLYGHLREFFVVDPDDGSPIVGCCGLAIAWDNLAEVRSLAVDERMRGAGFGRKLVDACLSEAVTLGIYKVFTLTYQDNFFRKMGFVEVTKDTLPQKVWADCINCPKFPECDEIAMQIEL